MMHILGGKNADPVRGRRGPPRPHRTDSALLCLGIGEAQHDIDVVGGEKLILDDYFKTIILKKILN